ncbi:MAG: hypothetical protein ACI38Q_08845 [Candidatus Bruticola sp.]
MRRYRVALEKGTELNKESEYLLENRNRAVKVNLLSRSGSDGHGFELSLISSKCSKLAACAAAVGAVIAGPALPAEAASFTVLPGAPAQAVSLHECFAYSALRPSGKEIVLDSAVKLEAPVGLQIAQASYHTNGSTHVNQTPVPHTNSAWSNHSNTGGHSNGDWANHGNTASGTGHVNLVHGDFLF